MMKNLKNITVGVLSTTFLFGACSKFLEKAPDNRTELTTPDNVRSLLATAYPHGGYQKMAETMSDNAQDKGASQQMTVMDSSYYNFQDFISDEGTQDSPTEYWSACYSAIAAANAALDAISNAPDSIDYAASKGEALVCRAYAHFMLVTLFAKPYNDATSASDPGIPYVTAPEKVVYGKYTRGTVKEDYDNIEKDLLEGLPLIDDQNYSVPKYHFTKVAANAFATRFYLYKKEYQKVVDYATEAFPGNTFISNMRPWLTQYATMTVGTLQETYTRATQSANLLLAETPSLWARTFTSTRYGFSPAMYNVFFPGTSVVGVNTGSRWAQANFIYIRSGQSNYFIPKWNEYFYTPDDPNYGYPYVMAPLFTTEEVLFNRAEAYIYLGNYDAALADLNTYISQRIRNYTSNDNITVAKATTFYGTDAASALISSLLFLKRMEFIQEGMRWFDNLRYGMTIKHVKFAYNDNIAQIPSDTVTLSPTSNYRQWQIPQSAISAGIPQNPRP